MAIDIYPQGQTQNKPTPTFTPPPIPSTNKIWATKLREVIAQLGYTEKGTEIDNGGDISESIFLASSEVLRIIKAQLPGLQVKVSSGNDSYHQGLSYGSKHKIGNAVDFTVSLPTPDNLNKIVNILQVYKTKNPAFKFIDEYRNPSSKATAGHIHMQVA